MDLHLIERERDLKMCTDEPDWYCIVYPELVHSGISQYRLNLPIQYRYIQKGVGGGGGEGEARREGEVRPSVRWMVCNAFVKIR